MLSKEFLEKMELSAEVAEKILSEYAKDMAAEQDKLQAAEADRDSYKDKFTAADQSLRELKDKDIEGTEAELEAYKQKYDALEKKMAADAYKRTVENYVGGYNFTSDLAKKAVITELLDKELKLEDGKLLGADDIMKTIKDANPGAFVAEETGGKKTPKYDGQTHQDDGQPMTYTREAIEKMTPEEINAHWTDIQDSLKNIE